MSLIKPVAEYIALPLAHIINDFIKTHTFPRQWKIARICLIPKVEIWMKILDYRPISVLPILSKIFERIVLQKMMKFIEYKFFATNINTVT